MQSSSRTHQLLSSFIGGLLVVAPPPAIAAHKINHIAQQQSFCQQKTAPNFLVVGGGPNPFHNEIALEKNVLYFQRTLQALGFNPNQASAFFANGNDGKATVRYINNQGQEQFEVPEIPNLKGAATIANLQDWFQQIGQQRGKSIFFYFTGHGSPNPETLDNNAFYLWNEQPLTVRQLTQMLDKLPKEKPVVAMMAQCFSGSFANFIYEGGDPKRPVALQTRCGFFATISSRPSVGCTPQVNEADYRDYSSSFFAGLSGRDRTGKKVASADYNKDGRVSYAEAHAFAKVDEKSIDLPVSTSEAWLQNQASEKQAKVMLSQPITQILKTARSEQRYVVNSLDKMFGLNEEKSLLENLKTLSPSKIKTDDQEAYITRLAMEIININQEKQIRTSGNQQDIATLNRLLKCESGSWDSL